MKELCQKSAGTRLGGREEASQETAACIEDGMHEDRGNDAKTSEVGAKGHDERESGHD